MTDVKLIRARLEAPRTVYRELIFPSRLTLRTSPSSCLDNGDAAGRSSWKSLEQIPFRVVCEIFATQSPDGVEKLSFVPHRIPPVTKRQGNASAGEDGIVSLSPRLTHGGRHSGTFEV